MFTYWHFYRSSIATFDFFAAAAIVHRPPSHSPGASAAPKDNLVFSYKAFYILYTQFFPAPPSVAGLSSQSNFLREWMTGSYSIHTTGAKDSR